MGISQANDNNAQLSDLQMENLEALAQYSEELQPYCHQLCHSAWYVHCDLGYSSGGGWWRCEGFWPN
ncbi:MAG: NVEALA domain-containing protein [Bacteroidales bacterium]|nr:NVEALA domain-containing protein [Bacteroidales bacterium]